MTLTTPIDAIDPVPERKPRKPRGNGKALAPVEAIPAPAPVSQGDAFLQMIERAARDPQVDIDKMERLFQMHERAASNRAKAAYLAALAEMQPDLPIVTKRGVIKTNEKDAQGQKTGNQKPQSKYALWEDINEAITPVLAKCGFSLSFRVAQPTPDRVAVTAVLGHRDGHSEETTLALPIDATGSKNNVQGWGSSVSYGKRYTALALLNISARGEDDDGNAAGAPEYISDAQCQTILDKIAETESDIERFCRYMKVDGVAKIPAKDYQRAIEALEAKRRK